MTATKAKPFFMLTNDEKKALIAQKTAEVKTQTGREASISVMVLHTLKKAK